MLNTAPVEGCPSHFHAIFEFLGRIWSRSSYDMILSSCPVFFTSMKTLFKKVATGLPYSDPHPYFLLQKPAKTMTVVVWKKVMVHPYAAKRRRRGDAGGNAEESRQQFQIVDGQPPAFHCWNDRQTARTFWLHAPSSSSSFQNCRVNCIHWRHCIHCCNGRYFLHKDQPMYCWWFYYMWTKVVGPQLNPVLSKLNVKTAADVDELLDGQ